MNNLSDYERKKIESKIEDILLLYAADSMATMDTSLHDNVSWSGTAEKAAYKLGRSLRFPCQDISFGVPALDEAMKKGYMDHINMDNDQHFPQHPQSVNICYIA